MSSILFPNHNKLSLLLSTQAPLQIKEFGAITNIDFSPVAPHNFAVTAFTRVCWLLLCNFPLVYFWFILVFTSIKQL